MNNMAKFFVTISVFIILFSLFLPRLNAYTQDIETILYDPQVTISMDLKDASLKDILKIFSIQSGLNFIASEAVQDRSITLYLDRVPLEEAMSKIFKANNLSYELGGDSNILIVKDWGKVAIETVTQVFYLKYATVSTSPLEGDINNYMAPSTDETGAFGPLSSSSTGSSATTEGDSEDKEKDKGITKAIRTLLSKAGNIIEDPRTNSLIITDTPNRMEVIAKVIASLDIPQPQVMLEVEMLDVNKNAVDKLGLNWAAAGSFAMTVISAARMTGFPLGPAGHMGAGLAKVTNDSIVGDSAAKYNAGEINFPTNFKWVFDFLRTQTDTKILARPRLMTLSNRTAEIQIVTNESIGTVQAVSGGGTAAVTTSTTEAERSLTGVSLRVTPQVNAESGEITMFIYPSVRNATTSVTFAGGTSSGGTALPTYKDPAERTTKQVVRIKDGETVILGGLIRREISETITKLPFLGDIPLLGNFFRHKYKDKDEERELLVFITPHIVKDTDLKLAQARNATALPEREQAVALGTNRESLINSNLKRFEKKR
ncbi:MAG: secretin and TonB N-terminal domain-containing protein [Candidatus Omnitrophica bacterium]|nr:secretin and TonB N-terminal domain-containing protein [Candidatus Omnitrophota bacterium]MBL7210497.1 secretin and TonB N-terminal domain-containing protein [Candidatus Omnitrophota bacterium]